MPELKRILVPVDFSDASRDALRHALELATTFDADVHALHVWEPSPYLSPDAVVWLKGEQQSFWEHMKHQLDERLNATVGEVVTETSSDTHRHVETEVVSGYTSETILSTIREGGFDMVVMGTRGRTGLSHLLLGSVAERIVRMATCPVMTIRSRESSSETGETDLPKGFDTPTML